MTDRNGREIKTGDVVVVTGSYFANDNGTYRVKHSPADANWGGTDHCLRRIKKDGTEAKTNTTAFWPLTAFTSDREKNIAAKKHNAEFAAIEVVDFEPAKARKPQEGTKFMYNGIKVNGELYKGWYSMGNWGNMSEKTIAIVAAGYARFPRNLEGLKVVNNSNSMIDYFEDDCIYVRPNNRHYAAALAAYERQEEKRIARRGRRAA